MIYEFDEETELESIKNNYSYIDDLKNSLADNAGKYRNFSKDVNLDFNILKDFIHKYERTLLIDCYTFSERLLKNTIYAALNFKSNDEMIDIFIKKKINPDQYSPSVKYNEFEKELKSFNEEFKFILRGNNKNIKIYNEMISSRHRYAHANLYPFNYDNYKDVIVVLEYLCWECHRFLSNHRKYDHIQPLFESIFNTKEMKKMNNSNVTIRTVKGSKKAIYVNLRNNCKNICAKYGRELESIDIFQDLIMNFEKIKALDLRSAKEKDFLDVYTKVKTEYLL